MSFLSIKMNVLVNMQSDELIILEETFVALSIGKGLIQFFELVNCIGLESHLSLKGNQILKVVF